MSLIEKETFVIVVKSLYLNKYFPTLNKDGQESKVDIYLPDNLYEEGWLDKKRPCIIICPGGGYFMCSQREAEPVALNFLPEGYNVFILNYSVAPNKFPCQLCEVAALIELIHINSDEWHCDTDKISIMGFSAGGHLAAHYSTSFDCKEIREIFPESKPVAATILCYPVITADSRCAHIGSFQNLLGKREITDEEIKMFSCEKLVSENTPPAFIWHTAEDDFVPVENSILYANALANNKIPFELHIFPYGRHGLSTANEQTCEPLSKNVSRTNEWLDDAKKWLAVIFKIH